jgi:hypothetical protein
MTAHAARPHRLLSRASHGDAIVEHEVLAMEKAAVRERLQVALDPTRQLIYILKAFALWRTPPAHPYDMTEKLGVSSGEQCVCGVAGFDWRQYIAPSGLFGLARCVVLNRVDAARLFDTRCPFLAVSSAKLRSRHAHAGELHTLWRRYAEARSQRTPPVQYMSTHLSRSSCAWASAHSGKLLNERIGGASVGTVFAWK